MQERRKKENAPESLGSTSQSQPQLPPARTKTADRIRCALNPTEPTCGGGRISLLGLEGNNRRRVATIHSSSSTTAASTSQEQLVYPQAPSTQSQQLSQTTQDSLTQFYRSSLARAALLCREQKKMSMIGRSRSRSSSPLRRSLLTSPNRGAVAVQADDGAAAKMVLSTENDELKTGPPPLPERNYFDFACPIDQVTEFVKSVCRRVFTIGDVWGSRGNLNHFLASVDKYLRLGHRESLTLMQVLICPTCTRTYLTSVSLSSI